MKKLIFCVLFFFINSKLVCAVELLGVNFDLKFDSVNYNVEFFQIDGGGAGREKYFTSAILIIPEDLKKGLLPVLSFEASDATSVVRWKGQRISVPHNLVLLLDKRAGGWVVLDARENNSAIRDQAELRAYLSRLLSERKVRTE